MSKITGKNQQQVDIFQVEQEQVRQRMSLVKNRLLVLSGKGGVGKSTVAVNLAAFLAKSGKRVGLLDIDIHGPSIPRILNLEKESVTPLAEAILPVKVNDNLTVMSIGFLLPSRDDAVIWRGPMKYNMIKQFLKDVEWGELDFLIVDCPPGTGDEPLAIVQLLEKPEGAIIVTTPQEVCLSDVRKSVTFCRSLNTPVLGVIENMSGFICPECGKRTDIFKSGGGRKMAEEMGVPFLAEVPIDPDIMQSCESGNPYILSHEESEVSKAFELMVQKILRQNNKIPTSNNITGKGA